MPQPTPAPAVSQIIAGSGIAISPTTGTGVVTITATGGGSGPAPPTTLAEINSAIVAANAAGVSSVSLGNGFSYSCNAAVYLDNNVSLYGNGATLFMTVFDTFIRTIGDGVPVTTTVITQNPVAGTNTVHVTSAAGISVGTRVALRLGDNSYDNNESPIWAATSQVLGITGNVLTIDRIIPYNINVVGATNNKNVDVLPSYPHDAYVRDLFLEGSGSTVIDGGTLLFWGRNFVFDNIAINRLGGLNFGYGLYLQYCENVSYYNTTLYHNENTGGQSSLGRMFNFAACHGVYVYDAICNDVFNNFAFVEDYCENINFFNPTIMHFNNPSGQVLFGCLVSKIYVENLTVVVPNSYDVISFGSTGSDPFTSARFRNMTLQGAFPRIMPAWPSVSGLITYSDGTNTFSLDLDVTVERTLTVPLTAGMNGYFLPDSGFLVALSVMASVSNLTQISAVFMGTPVNNGANITSQLVANQWVDITPQNGGIFGSGGNLYGALDRILSEQVRFLIQTSGDPGGSLLFRCTLATYV
jgi:hypothetical protein